MKDVQSAQVTVAATQMPCGWNVDANLVKAENIVREAAAKGAQIILLQELFERVYFCQEQNEDYFQFAQSVTNNRAIRHFAPIAKELNVVLPISFFERANNVLFNSLVVIDADGSVLHTYRKTHIPDGPGYCEKFYFSPGDTGFQVWQTQYGKIGVGICWDQWFPETARALALKGAEIIFYPTAIGSEPQNPSVNSKDHWQLTQQGHAAANLVPVVVSNRVGREQVGQSDITFYGHSFITDEFGQVVNQMDGHSEGFITHTLDLAQCQHHRLEWGLFRDRRPDQYPVLLSKDGAE